MQNLFGYPALTDEIKRKILGLNSARLYGLKPGHNLAAQCKPAPKDYLSKMRPEFRKRMEVDKPLTGMQDDMDRMRHRYADASRGPDHMRFGWIAKA